MTYTHTYALLDVSEDVYEEIKLKLERAGYGGQIYNGEIDMHGIALVKEGAKDKLARESVE